MIPASTSRRLYERTKVLIVEEESRSIKHSLVSDFPRLFKEGDLLVVNRSGTMPSSFMAHIERTGEALELRLAGLLGPGQEKDVRELKRWRAVTFGAGDWQIPNEDRGTPPLLRVGDLLRIGSDLAARVTKVDSKFHRLIEIDFESANLLPSLYTHGKPIQYSYLKEELKVWDQQTIFSGPPISVEPPSASFPLNWKLLHDIQESGVQIASLLHAAGLSSTGDEKLDQLLPFDEYYSIPGKTMRAIKATMERGGRIIALGTTVTRAIETAFRANDDLSFSTGQSGRADLVLSGKTPAHVVDILITGMHEPGTSHAVLMQAFSKTNDDLAKRLEAEATNYRSHEFGDLTMLIRCGDSTRIGA